MIGFGELVIDRDLMLYIVQGLRTRYTTFVTFFNMLYVRPILGEFHNMFKSHDRMLLMQSNYEPSNSFQAHVANDVNVFSQC